MIQACNPEKAVIISHSDHDGYTADALLNTYFKNRASETAEILPPSNERPYHVLLSEVKRRSPEVLFIVDALVSSYRNILTEIAESGTVVVNLDHHDPIEIDVENFLSLNPHRDGKQYINSSGLVWGVLRELDDTYFEQRAWFAAIGAAQDYCIDDQTPLFELAAEQGYVDSPEFSAVLSSDLLKAAKMVNASVNKYSPEKVYEVLFRACRKNEPDLIFDNKFFQEAYHEYIKGVENVYSRFQEEAERYLEGEILAFDLDGEPISIISDICERDLEEAVYMGYSDGIIGLRALWIEEDVQELAECLGGGGPHPHVGGAKTNESFSEAVSTVISEHERLQSQQDLSDFSTP